MTIVLLHKHIFKFLKMFNRSCTTVMYLKSYSTTRYDKNDIINIELNLSINPVTTERVEENKKNWELIYKQLFYFIFYKMAVRSKYEIAVERLRRNDSTLTHLYLSSNQISNIDALADALKINTTLIHLSLGNNQISDLNSLADALKINITLISLLLDDNQISNIDALAEALKFNTTLTRLDLSRNKISNIDSLAKVLEINDTLINLFLFENQISIDALVKILTINTTLAHLYISYNQSSNLEKINYIKERLLQNRNTRPNRIVTLYDLFMQQFGTNIFY